MKCNLEPVFKDVLIIVILVPILYVPPVNLDINYLKDTAM